MGYVSQWGGMDVGSGMMFSAETIDGLLHQLGGLRFRAECSLVPPHPYSHAYLNQQRPKVSSSSSSSSTTNNSTVSNSSKEEYNIEESNNIIVNSPNLKTKCPVGTAVSMSAVGGEIPTHYDHIIHTVPPFYHYPPLITDEMKELLGIEMQDGEDDNEENLHQWSKELLRSCYRQSFNLAFGIHNEEKGKTYESFLNNPLAELIGLGKQQSLQSHQRVHSPLLGAGCRDFPKEVAMEVAALESTSWLLSHSKEEEGSDSRKEWVVAFGLLESEDAQALSNCIGEKMSRLRSNDG